MRLGPISGLSRVQHKVSGDTQVSVTWVGTAQAQGSGTRKDYKGEDEPLWLARHCSKMSPARPHRHLFMDEQLKPREVKPLAGERTKAGSWDSNPHLPDSHHSVDNSRTEHWHVSSPEQELGPPGMPVGTAPTDTLRLALQDLVKRLPLPGSPPRGTHSHHKGTQCGDSPPLTALECRAFSSEPQVQALVSPGRGVPAAPA